MARHRRRRENGATQPLHGRCSSTGGDVVELVAQFFDAVGEYGGVALRIVCQELRGQDRDLGPGDRHGRQGPSSDRVGVPGEDVGEMGSNLACGPRADGGSLGVGDAAHESSERGHHLAQRGSGFAENLARRGHADLESVRHHAGAPSTQTDRRSVTD